MSRAAIELDDVAVVVQADDDTPPLRSPAVALVADAGLEVGEDAERRRRLEPRRIHDHFWYDLSTETLRRPYGGRYSTADIAHAHLEKSWRKSGVDADEVLLTVPGDLSPERLGLILGIARAAGVPVAGLVDAAVAAVADHGPVGPSLHLEIFRHRAVATVLDDHEQKVFRLSTAVEENVGLIRLEAAWAQSLADEFVKATRYDPLDRAESEQVLHDHLWTWLDAVRARGAVRLEMNAGERVHSVDISEGLFVDSVDSIYRDIERLTDRAGADSVLTRLFLGHRAAGLPRLAERLRQATGLEVSSLPMAAAANGALRHAGSIISPDDDVAMVVELTTGSSSQLPLAKPEEAGPVTVPALGPRPTHVLHRGLAHRIPSAGLVIGLMPPSGAGGFALVGETAGVSRRHLTVRREGAGMVVEDHSRYGTLLNGVPLDAVSAVVAGDRLKVGSPGIELELIATVDRDGSA